jgi:uncharacterized membrane protein required for colicin V production
MTWLDWVMVALAIWFVLQGLLKGFTVAALGAVAVLVAYVGSAVAMPSVGDPLGKWVNNLISSAEFTTEWARTVGFSMVFVFLYALIVLLIGFLPGAKRPEMTGQLLGAGMGLVKALFASAALVGILLASPLSKGVADDLTRSLFAGHVAAIQREGIQTLRNAIPVSFEPYGPDKKF